MTKHISQPGVLRPEEAATFLGVSRRTLYQLSETDPNFPRKIVFSARCVGWRRESLEQYLRTKEGAV